MGSSLRKDSMAAILSLDPGTKNYGYAVWETSSGRAQLRQAGRIFTTVIAPNRSLREQVEVHSTTLESLIEEFQITHIIAERYQSRRMGGTTIESVNMMLGAIAQICVTRGIHFKFIPASQWKNAINRVSDEYLVGEYDEGKPFKITPHTVDAVMIGVYGMGVMKSLNPFEGKLYKGRVAALVMKAGGLKDLGDAKGFLKFKPAKKKRRLRGARVK